MLFFEHLILTSYAYEKNRDSGFSKGLKLLRVIINFTLQFTA